jgi:DNA-binding PadR family transcriptional regulator
VNPSYRSPWALTILSLLFERDMHPYEMRRLVRHRGKDEFVDLRPGSLYRTIERLERVGLAEPVETTREGKFPERTVYRITDRGRDELLEWMRDLLSTPLNEYPQVVQALSVLALLEPDDARIQLEGRMLRLEREIAGMEATMRRLEPVLPRIFEIESELALALRRAELDWVRALVEDLRTGRLTWSREQLQAESANDKPLDLPTGLEVLDSEREDRGMA